MGNEFDGFGFDEIFKEAMQKEKPTIKDIADQYKIVIVKCPCCEHKLKIKVKV